MLTATIFGAVGGLLVSGLFLIIGGLGGIRLLNRRMTALQDDVQLLDERITREVKMRAGKISALSRESQSIQAEELVGELKGLLQSSQQMTGR